MHGGFPRMADTGFSPELSKYFRALRKNDDERKTAIQDLKAIAELQSELGENDNTLNEYIVQQELAEEKLDRALTKRGF